MSLEKLKSMDPGTEAYVDVYDPSIGRNKRIRVAKPQPTSVEFIDRDIPTAETTQNSPTRKFVNDEPRRNVNRRNRSSQRSINIITKPVRSLAGLALGATAFFGVGQFAGHTLNDGIPDNPKEFITYFIPDDSLEIFTKIDEGEN
jgi:hypothetical protein